MFSVGVDYVLVTEQEAKIPACAASARLRARVWKGPYIPLAVAQSSRQAIQKLSLVFISFLRIATAGRGDTVMPGRYLGDYCNWMPQPGTCKTAVFSDDRGKRARGYCQGFSSFPFDSETVLGRLVKLSVLLDMDKPVFCERGIGIDTVQSERLSHAQTSAGKPEESRLMAPKILSPFLSPGSLFVTLGLVLGRLPWAKRWPVASAS